MKRRRTTNTFLLATCCCLLAIVAGSDSVQGPTDATIGTVTDDTPSNETENVTSYITENTTSYTTENVTSYITENTTSYITENVTSYITENVTSYITENTTSYITENETWYITENTTWFLYEDSTTSTSGGTSTDAGEDSCNVTCGIQRYNETTLQVSWSGDVDAYSSVTVQWTQLCGTDPSCNEAMSNKSVLFANGSVEIRVERNALYRVDAEFECRVNDSSWTIPIPAGAPNLTTTKTNTSVALFWNPFLDSAPVQLLRYVIVEEESEATRRTDDTEYAISDLDPYTNYTFLLYAEFDEIPQEDWSDRQTVRTDIGVPHAPTALNTTSVGNTTVVLTWEAPKVSTGPILEYRILYQVAGGGRLERNTSSTDMSYRVRGLTPNERYTFAVQAVTEAGPGKESKGLEVQTDVGVPCPPTALNTTFVGNTTVVLSWEAPDMSTGHIREYRIRWEDSSSLSQENDTGSSNTSYKVDGLSPYEWYIFAVLAITDAGTGNWSENLEVQTDAGVPYAPTNLTTTFVGNTTVGLTWEAPEASTGPILQYRTRWKDSGGGGREKDTGSNDTSCVVDGLTPYEGYAFAVLAVTKAGPGNWSEDVRVTTDVGVPTVPRNFQIHRKTDASLDLSWSRPEFAHSPEIQYVLGWEASHQEGAEVAIPENVAKDTVRYVLGDLLPYTNYTVQVSAETGAGRGPATRPLRAQTEVGVPRPAVIREVTIPQKRTARVAWKTEGPFPGPVQFSLQAWKHPGLCSVRVSAVVDGEVKGDLGPEDWTAGHARSVEGLAPYGQYSFVVRLSTTATDGVASNRSEAVRVPPEAPGRPQNVIVDCLWSSTQARVSWQPPRAPNGRILSYTVRYGIVGQYGASTVSVGVSDVCGNQSRVISGMRPETRYRVTVTATVEAVSEEGTPASPVGFCELPAGIPFLGNASRLLASSSAPRHVTLEWTGDAFSEYMGEIVRYAVLVGKEMALGDSVGGWRPEVTPTWTNFSSGTSDFYQATPPNWNPFGSGPDPLDCQTLTIDDESNRTVLSCTIGSQWPCPDNETYCNGPLEPDTFYELKIRGFTRRGYNETQLLYARTGPLPKTSAAGKVVAAVVSLVLVGALAGGCYVMKRRGKLEPIVDAVWSKIRPAKGGGLTRGEPAQEMQRATTSRPVPTRHFSEHVRRMMSDSHLQFSSEFEELKSASPLLPCTVAESEDNRLKNRWMNIFPFDHSRVKLLPLCDDPWSDFINASYIPGPSSPREYIASQGPLSHTLDDFWRMVWEQSVTTIVMLTQCTERGKRKCERYWPEAGEARHYGDLAVTTVSESMLSAHVIRVIRLQLGSYNRQVKQMHFVHWPDFGCPDGPEDLIEFVGAVRDHLPRTDPGPILVHCSAGVGRTGTFIAVDRLSRQLRGAAHPGDDAVDIYGTVLELRHHRTNMVQTEDQYIYIHLCVRQLIWARDDPPGRGENIYSNVEEVDTSF